MSPALETRLDSMVELLQTRAAEPDNATSYTFLDDQESWDTRRLEERARAIAAGLQSTGRPGDRVLLLYPPSLEYLASFFGCLFAGQIAVPAYPPGPRNMARLAGITASAAVTTVCTTRTLLAAKGELFADISDDSAWLATDEIPNGMAALWKDGGCQRSDVAFLQYTSGSTAHPKGVTVTHGNLLHQLHSLGVTASMDRDDRVVSWLPPYHDMGLIGGLLSPVYTRMSLMLMSPISFLRHPARWLEAITRHRGTVSVAPNFAYELCTRKVSDAQLAHLDLSTWDVMMSGAEPVRMDTMRRFIERFGPCGARWEAVYPCYGLAESTLMASGTVRRDAPRSVVIDRKVYERGDVVRTESDDPNGFELASCGTSLPNQTAIIVDPERRERLPDGRVGEIWLQGPSVAQGYWGLRDETAESFRATVRGEDAAESSGYMRTGDLGFWLNGHLYVSGRLKDVIILNGLKYHPEDIEFSLNRCHPSLRPGGAAAFAVGTDRDEVVVVHEIERADPAARPEIVEEIRRAVRTGLGLELDIVLLVGPRTIPKTSSGKVQRNACRAAFLSDEIDGYRWLRAASRQLHAGPRAEEHRV